MDKFFDNFFNYQGFGPIVETHEVPAESMERYRGKLPDQLLSYWQEYGWSGFAQGLFWLVNPADWDDAMKTMLEDSSFLERDAYHVIARNAFGDLWLWGEKTGPSISTISCRGMIFPNFDTENYAERGPDRSVQLFFSAKSQDAVNLQDDHQQPLFARALEKLGPLTSTEMYGFVPFVGASGKCVLENLQKVDALVHMELLADMTPMRVMPDYCEAARNAGLL